ncbi:F-box protein [Thraustotheca clavata]|uniref:F-box protein n=1 Tax=Thraustotheca clavata TaxID=74557 RepID=A0A1V9YUH5_9STRA|nr:F-box protein [Thraustotheca clavata]
MSVPVVAAPYPRRSRRDEDAEALEQALNESLQPDFLAQIVQAENEMRQLSLVAANSSVNTPVIQSVAKSQSSEEDEEDLGLNIPDDIAMTSADSKSLEDANAEVAICQLPERMIMILLEFLDEDSIGFFGKVCHHFHRVASTEYIYEIMCRRVFLAQCRGRLVKLGKFHTWSHMFRTRPRVKYHGMYMLRISYYKEPEWNMWTDLPKNAILLAIYYRYFNFRKDGTFLYAMTHRHPRETSQLMKRQEKDTVFKGTYYFQCGQVHAIVDVSHGTLEFIFRVAARWRAPNTQLVLLSHAVYQPSDRLLLHPHYFDVKDEEFNFRRYWDL